MNMCIHTSFLLAPAFHADKLQPAHVAAAVAKNCHIMATAGCRDFLLSYCFFFVQHTIKRTRSQEACITLYSYATHLHTHELVASAQSNKRAELSSASACVCVYVCVRVACAYNHKSAQKAKMLKNMQPTC